MSMLPIDRLSLRGKKKLDMIKRVTSTVRSYSRGRAVHEAAKKQLKQLFGYKRKFDKKITRVTPPHEEWHIRWRDVAQFLGFKTVTEMKMAYGCYTPPKKRKKRKKAQ